ncbi:L-threonylcarbamoyladenylate synthase [Candidatus Marifrigoribacter sp. Uisw_064]|uniref:L-threonylcarbamoyladenylate synthase n=1 Tax=Candidatus Marifrigoribacter sp. Uisw_064 TaxID=3230970 RepID=UPI003D54EB40
MQEEINNSLNALKKGGLILYPTDTIWGIGCDATNAAAVEKVFELKKRDESKSLICLVSDIKMLDQYIQEIPEVIFDLLKYAVRPTTIILDRPLHVAENLIASDNSIAFRIVKDPFCNKLIRKLKRPIVSTSANISDKKAPNNFQEISNAIKDGVDYVVNLNQNKKSGKPSTIIKVENDGTVKIIRS